MTELNNFLDRKSLIADKTEINDEILEQLYELSEEEVNFESLEKFTDKKFRDLSQEERFELIKALEKADYKKYKNCYISTSKLLYEKSETLIKEIKALNVLNDLGYSVYLLPYGYARSNQDLLQKSADSITNHNFLEFKNIISEKPTAGESAFKDARKQSDNMFFYYENLKDKNVAVHAIVRNINASKKELLKQGLSYNYEGEIFFHFQQTGQTMLVSIDKWGYVRDKNILSFGLKNIEAAHDSPVVELFDDKSSPLPDNNIKQTDRTVNNNSPDSEKNDPAIKEVYKIIEKRISEKEAKNWIDSLSFSMKINDRLVKKNLEPTDKNLGEACFYVLNNMNKKERKKMLDIMTQSGCVNAQKTKEYLRTLHNNLNNIIKNHNNNVEKTTSKDDDISISD